ncbi:MAG: type IV secretion system DNA-binding domain-containing protein [Candidatus Acidiferrum sp.]
MKQRWGREDNAGEFPSDRAVWTIGAFCVALLSVFAIGYYRYMRVWTPLQRHYLLTYAGTPVAGAFRTDASYTLLMAVTRKGTRLALDNEAEPFVTEKGESTFALTEEALKIGDLKLEWQRARYDNAKLHEFLGHWIYQDQTLTDLAQPAVWGGLGVLLVGLAVAIPMDSARRRIRKHGRRLKGPELVTVRAFNRRNRSDGIGFLQQQSFTQKILRKKAWLQLPREIESSHILVMGDSGKGKSALIRQILLQIEERGETAIVYDPATPADYVPYFLTPSRGDLILNPLDQRMPYWTPGDELRQGADSLTLAASLFPDRHNENSFFVEAPRKIFAHLLGFHPTPQELVWWMSHPEEIDRRVKGTEYAAMIDRESPPQRNGVLGSLSMVADAMKLLPSEAETKGHWSTLEWSKERRGWLFLTSTPDTRKRLAPLISLWLDMLVLRLMNQGRTSPRPVWFILDELATLQRLPQLHTAITENRKSNNPVVLGFQGRSQLEVRYGHEAEAMMSQPSTKIFLCTSEPHAAKWISDTIGEQEIERIRESRTSGEFPQSRKSKSYNLEREIRPLVMASEISGLEKMHGYLKCGNLVARMSLPYIELESKEPQYSERPAQQPPEEPPKVAAAAAGAGKRSGNGASGQELVPNQQQQSEDQKIQRGPARQQRDFFE